MAKRFIINNKNKLTVLLWRRERVVRTEMNKNSVATFSLDTFYSTDHGGNITIEGVLSEMPIELGGMKQRDLAQTVS